jgi:hypothetical protein
MGVVHAERYRTYLELTANHANNAPPSRSILEPNVRPQVLFCYHFVSPLKRFDKVPRLGP